MNGRKREGGGMLGAGGMMLLVAMCALCLAVFAMLAMSAAMRHKASSDACLAETAGWYEACLEAESQLAADRASGAPGTYEYTYWISDAQELRTSYEILADGSWRIGMWATVPSGDWEQDLYIEVIH